MTEEKDCLTCPQAKNYERLEKAQIDLYDRGVKRDLALVEIKGDTAVVKVEVQHMSENVKEIKGVVKELKDQPGKNWQDLMKVIITMVATAAFTSLFFSK
jgi:hypothetical protein